MFWFKLKRIMNSFLINSREENKSSHLLTRKSSSSVRKNVSLRKRSKNLRETVIRVNLSINSFVKHLILQALKTKISPQNLRVSITLWELAKVSLINQLSKEKTSEKSIWSLLIKINSSIQKLISVFWAFSNMRESTKIIKRKLKITSNATRKLETCSTERKLCVDFSTKFPPNSIRQRSRLPISAEPYWSSSTLI